jgi:predicted dehydrogenase/threonine dehydrogenase-like Zn-dependent dehydrogenase
MGPANRWTGAGSGGYWGRTLANDPKPTLKQVLTSYRTGKLEIAEVSQPRPAPNELLVHTTASVVSAGTERAVIELGQRSLLGKAQDRPDLVRKVVDKVSRDGAFAAARAAFARLDASLPLGYSCAGRVIELGTAVRAFAVGDRVACAGAGLANHAQVNAVPAPLCVRIPEGVDDESAAFVTLGAIALQGVRTAVPQVGETVAVLGLGLIGQLTAQILRAAGCHVLAVDLDPAKVHLAGQLGARRAALRSDDLPQIVAGMTDGRGADAVIVCAAGESGDALELSGELARDRAKIVVVGAVPLHAPRKLYYEKELSLLVSRSYGPGRYDRAYEEGGHDYPPGYVRWTERRNFEAFLDLCRGGQIDVRSLVTHRFPIDGAEQAYRLLAGETVEPYLGILLTYPDEVIAAPPAPRQVKPVRGERLTLGVAGAGAFAAGVLLPAFSHAKQASFHTIVSARGVSARQLGERFAFREVGNDFAQLCRDPSIDAIVIATRHDLHARQTVAALEAGKHVFVEKPLALNPAELALVRRAAETSERQLLVGFNRRFAPLARKLREFLSDRGQPILLNYRVNAGPIPSASWIQDPAVGGGRIVGEVCHFVDLCAFLLGSLPVEVSALAIARDDHPTDQLSATLRFEDGSIATIIYGANGDASYPKERLEALGDGRVAVLEDFRVLELSQRGSRRYARNLSQDKGHRAEAEAFVRACLRGENPPISPESLWRTTETTFAIEAALQTGLPQRVAL